MLKFLILTSAFFICNAANYEFRGRGIFGYTYTSTVLKSKIVTSLVPSSCVRVEPTLPPCRNIRFLRFPKLPSISFNNPANDEIVNTRTNPIVETTSLGWGEYFGIYAPTVTVTETQMHITTVQDPSVVVTFAIKGCRPMKMPLDLDRCPPEDTSALVIEEILETSTIAKPIIATETLLPTKTLSQVLVVPTAIPGGTNGLPENHNFEDSSNLLEASKEDRIENVSVQPTQPLLL